MPGFMNNVCVCVCLRTVCSTKIDFLWNRTWHLALEDWNNIFYGFSTKIWYYTIWILSYFLLVVAFEKNIIMCASPNLNAEIDREREREDREEKRNKYIENHYLLVSDAIVRVFHFNANPIVQTVFFLFARFEFSIRFHS